MVERYEPDDVRAVQGDESRLRFRTVAEVLEAFPDAEPGGKGAGEAFDLVCVSWRKRGNAHGVSSVGVQRNSPWSRWMGRWKRARGVVRG